MVDRTRIPTAMYPSGYTPSTPSGKVTPEVMTKDGSGEPINEEMIQDYPCGSEPGHSFRSSPLNIYSIGRSGAVVLYVEGGCPNFTWESDNAWATFSSATTSVRYNTIESDADEGQDTVATVTDTNGLEVTINVLWDGAATCCDDPPALSFQTLASELSPFPGEVVVFLDGGCPPFDWTVSGAGYTLDNAATNSRRNRLHGTEDNDLACVGVEDLCGQTATLCNCDCYVGDDIAYDTANSDETVDASGEATVVVTDGCPPFTWEVSGTGFSVPASTSTRTNTLTAAAGACGTAIITVTDRCEDECIGYVRCTTGQWVLKSETCHDDMRGKHGTTENPSSVDSDFEYIEGYQRQTSVSTYWGGSAHHLCEDTPPYGSCDQYCQHEPGTGGDCDYCIEWDPEYEAWRVPCINTPEPGYPNARKCYTSRLRNYYEWGC